MIIFARPLFMKRSVLILLFSLLGCAVSAQCLTDFTKLVPEPSVDAATGFGTSISMYDDYLAVGIPFNDSLGRATGIVHIYKHSGSNWTRVAAMAPSDPSDGMRHGITVKLSKDYLLVGAQPGAGKVYLYKRNSAGWQSGTELTSFSVSASSYFGILSDKCLSISDDQQTIAIVDPFYRTGSMSLARSGGIFVYHKGFLPEWSGSISPTIITSPEDDCQDFGAAGASMLGNRLVTGTQYAPNGVGRLYVYHDPSPGFQNPTLEARLDPSLPDPFDGFFFGMTVVQTEDGIFATGVIGLQSSPHFGILHFERPVSGTWTNIIGPSVYIEPKEDNSTASTTAFILSTNGTDLFASVRDNNGTGYFNVIRKGVTGWTSPTYELIDESAAPAPPLSNRYPQVHAVNQTATNAAVGFIPHPDNPNSMVAIRAMHKNGVSWDKQPVYPAKKTTAGHFFGANILGFDDYLFVTASHDGTVKPNAGAVYTYKKVGANWQKTGKILPPLGQSPYDDVFGSALASNETYLAVGASGHEPKGKFFMYKKTSADWSSVELVQELTIPEEGLTVYAYGDNVAMDDNWLVIPYVQNSPARVILAIFKFNGTTWDFKQVVEVGGANIFAKESTLDVAIENGVIVAASSILELNANDVWENKYTLYPSDPEPMQISPDFTHWISNGSLFGHSVAIHENTIFIGAPQRDYEGTWDVGAVYVYVKNPNEKWSSRTESAKLVPRVKDENELFGYAIKALYNTLIVGAPGSDFYKNNTARNKPGRAYVFQAEDYDWQDVVPLIDFTGDSFEKDYYGIAVHMDETDFFIGASIEDIENADLSGSVYVTPTPPIIKLVPPICQSNGLVDLLGYPFGGTWSGPGIVNAAEGIFDPMLTEPGVKIYSYITESCAYPGKLKIRIEPPIQAILQVNANQPICLGATVNRVLSVQPQNGCSYQWYFRTNSSQSFSPVGTNATSYTATKRGEYQVKVYNLICSTFSPVISVMDEIVELTLTQVPTTCNNKTEGITLEASPTGGQWSGPGVSNNVFKPENLPIGYHTLQYTYSSMAGCIYQQSIRVQVQRAFNPVIEYVSGNLCENGTVTLKLKGTAPANTSIEWLGQTDGNTYEVLEEDVSELTVSSTGSYKIQANTDVCTGLSAPYIVDDKLEVELKPGGSSFEICRDDSFDLSFEDVPGTTYQWFWTEKEDEIPTELSETHSSLTVDKSGYYSAMVERGACSFESDPIFVFILPADSIFVPNVFTPNNDGRNDMFEVITNKSIVSIEILNREGKKVYTQAKNSGWNGGDASPGIYYWLVTFIDCHERHKTIKGWVHLIR